MIIYRAAALKILIATSLVAFTLVLGSAQAEPDDDLRERCRKAVSSLYLDAFATHKHARDGVTSLRESLVKLRSAIRGAEKELAQLEKKLAKEPLSVEVAAARDGVQSKVDLYKEQQKTHLEMLSKAEVEEAQQQKKLQNFEQSMQKVFRIEKVNDPDDSVMVFWQVSYLSGCPPYREICPLPEKQARDLTTLLGESTPTPLDCVRYGNMR